MTRLLEINNLTIDFHAQRGTTRATDGVTLHLDKGETIGIVGESGSGKSVTALSVMRLLPYPGQISSGEIWYHPPSAPDSPVNLLSLPEKELLLYRGAQIAMIFQEPMTSLNPVIRCGLQVVEALQYHRKLDFREARSATAQLFDRVKMADSERVFQSYPHELSGGQKQRVMIAMAMSCHPHILIADEPTTALDVTVQKAILDLMLEWQTESGLSMLFISHDLGVISEVCDRVAVMFNGRVVEEGPVEKILSAPEHPYTKGLVASRPSLHRKLRRLPTVQDFVENNIAKVNEVTKEETESRRALLYAQKPILGVENLVVRYPAKKNWLGQSVDWLNAVDHVSFEVCPGETFGLAGESGCGKTTLGRAIARLTDSYSGKVRYRRLPGQNDGEPGSENPDLLELTAESFHPFRRDIQVVFQDPYSSLNPRMSIGAALMEPMNIHQLHENERIRKEKALELLEIAGLEAGHFHRYPHEFSGGQRQRICIARALAVEPRILICDEIVSSLDVSVQATVLNLLQDLQQQFGLTYLFISHDLSVIRQMCDRLMIMNRGKIEAIGFAEQIFDNPENEYVRRLISAVPGQ